MRTIQHTHNNTNHTRWIAERQSEILPACYIAHGQLAQQTKNNQTITIRVCYDDIEVDVSKFEHCTQLYSTMLRKIKILKTGVSLQNLTYSDLEALLV